MDMLKLKLRHKLLLVALPLILVLVYAAMFSLERRQGLTGARDVSQLARTTELLSIVHRLQN